MLKVVLACFAILVLTRFFVGTEAALSNGLALTQAEYQAAPEGSQIQSRRVVQAR